MKLKIYYHHTDCGGVVYYANYLKFLEEARTEFLEERGVAIKELARRDILFVVSHQEIDYKSPAFYGDTLQIDTQITHISAVRMEIEHQIKNQNGTPICNAKTVLACTGRDFKPKAIPEEIQKRLI